MKSVWLYSKFPPAYIVSTPTHENYTVLLNTSGNKMHISLASQTIPQPTVI